MGLTNTTLDYVVSHASKLRLSKSTKILDIGLQEIHCAGKSTSLRSFIHAFLPDRIVADDELTEFMQHCYLYDVCERFGLDYTCYEVCGERAFRFFDFNSDSVIPSEKNKYDLILNMGTSEHIANQFNFFKSCHELCKENGSILHIVPFSGYLHHGFFNYQPKFFFRLAEYNKYSVQDFFFFDEDAREYLDTIVINSTNQSNILEIAESFQSSRASIHVLLKKNGTDAFRPPVDHVFIGIDEALKVGIGVAPLNDAMQALLLDFPELAGEIACIFADKENRKKQFLGIPVYAVPESLEELQAKCSTLIVATSEDARLRKFINADIVPCVSISMVRSIMQKRVALIPASGELAEILNQNPHIRGYIQCIFDNQEEKHGSELYGLPIRKVPEAEVLCADYDILVITSEAYEIELLRQFEEKELSRVTIFSKRTFLRMMKDFPRINGQSEN